MFSLIGKAFRFVSLNRLSLVTPPKMSHNIQSSDRVVSLESCWHHLETIVPAITFDNSGLNWQVQSYPVLANGAPFPGWQALVRGDINQPLHIFKDSYGIIQNSQIWEAMQNALQGIPHQVVTTGSLGDSKRTFISIKLTAESDKYVRGDAFKSYLTFINSFDGFCTARLYGTDTRVVCQNTLDMSLGNKGFLDLSVKHTTNAAVRFNDMEKTVQAYLETKESHFANLASLAEKPMSLATAENVVAAFVKDDPKPGFSVRAQNAGKEIVNLFLGGKGNKGETRYDLLNGVTEYYTHNACKVPARSMLSNMFGAYAESKVEMLETLLDDAALNAMANRGAALLERESVSLI
jgi:phage/plasmid-like protein (TIGR03299 family)